MRQLLIAGVFLNAALLFAVWLQLGAVAQGGAGAGISPEFACYDANGDSVLDLGDPVTLLNWLFLGSASPQVCMAGEGGGLTPEQQEILSHMSLVDLPTATDEGGGILSTAKTIRIQGVNVQIVNGRGATNGNMEAPGLIDMDSTTVDGTGNLIVGYNELREGTTARSGSHNVIVGMEQDYTSFGGTVIGRDNTISAPFAAVTGGLMNAASAPHSVVSGGRFNTASGLNSSVSGGADNTAGGDDASVSGGTENQACGPLASVSGGGSNTASGDMSSVTGGSANTAQGTFAAIVGGEGNVASDDGQVLP